MSSFVIEGGNQLGGEITVAGSKNAALPLLAASLLTKEPVTLQEVPCIRDVEKLTQILGEIGADVQQDGSTTTITAASLTPSAMSPEIVGQLRGSILLLGALLGRAKHAIVPLPGGDIIGARPIDVHLDAFEQLGATVTQEGNVVTVDGSEMKPGIVTLREFSVTATENILMVAATLPGTTTIRVAAGEPHVIALANLLSSMGAQIEGAGTHEITVTGTPELTSATATVIPDMLEAGFFILLGAATKSDLRIHNVPVNDLPLFFKKLDDIGVSYEIEGSTVSVEPSALKSFKVQTLPQPGIATDLQAPFSVVATQAQGTSLIHDPMYESRFKHCDELVKMGASVTVCDPHRVVVEGPTPLRGQHISSLDIRSGATLIMAALIADGMTVIDDAETIDRGYINLDGRLRDIGAKITRDNKPLVEPITVSEAI